MAPLRVMQMPGSQKVASQTRLSRAQETAASLMAEGKLTGEQIAAQVGVTRRQLIRWLNLPQFAAFQERYREYQKRYADQVFTSGLSRRETRVAALQNVHEQMLSIIKARA